MSFSAPMSFIALGCSVLMSFSAPDFVICCSECHFLLPAYVTSCSTLLSCLFLLLCHFLLSGFFCSSPNMWDRDDGHIMPIFALLSFFAIWFLLQLAKHVGL